jgi:hypothetical protein
MAFYPQFSGFYAHPMYFPNQEFYAMYHPNGMDSNQVSMLQNFFFLRHLHSGKQGA